MNARTAAARRRRTAIHEAGHAVVAVVRGVTVTEVVCHVEPVGDRRGYVTHYGANAFDDIEIAAAGVAAESIRYRRPTWVSVLLYGGGGDHEFYDPLRKSIGRSERQLMSDVKRSLRQHWPSVLAVADRLLVDVKLTGDEVERIVAATPTCHVRHRLTPGANLSWLTAA